MWAISTAIVVGVIGFLTKLAFDVRAEHEGRRALAAALAGELGAYLRLLRPEQTMANFEMLAKFSAEQRAAGLDAFPSFPTGHPVFDRVADKIGSLPPNAARGVSEAYNVITSMRLFVTSFASDRFRALPNEAQQKIVLTVLVLFREELEPMRITIRTLDSISRERFLCRLVCGNHRG
jgi:hypothetical protein